ncbi:MAG TPA: dockerin type I domain-containing protein [Bryobacteraceae bacterium]|nr:dockerin type I domain-containing protein [Bryobacteraceae bacterium]
MPTSGRLFALLLALGLSQVLSIAQVSIGQSDTTPPTLVALSFSASTVNVSTAAQNLTVTATITDDLSGVNFGYIEFTSPSGQTAGGFQSGFFTRVSGTDLNGGYKATVGFPQFAEPGLWTAFVYLQDNAGNHIQLQSAALINLGFPGALTVVDSTPDTTPPTLLGASFSPSTVNTSAGPQSITVSLQVSDSQSGAVFSNSTPCVVNVYLSRAGAGATATLFLYGGNFTRVSGTAQNGVWQATLIMPQYSGGNWALSSACLSDAATNRVFLTPTQLAAMGINPVLTDSSTPADTTPPTLTGLSFTPPVVDTSSSSQNVTVTLSASDNISGVNFGLFNSYYVDYFVEFQSPSGNQTVSAFIPNVNQPAPIAGTPLAGTWQLTAQWPRFSEEGTWTLTSFQLPDTVGNYAFYTPAQVQALGFPTTIVITKPSLTPDGTIGATGGTVNDDAFGTRASITFPPGLVSSPTTVSIDVFPSPLSVPTPRGFTMPGTYFENLSFSPALPEPIPAPGITVVLPLLTPMTPGAQLNLYHIDPIIGLAPAMSASGQPVIGTVNAGGVSATFNNVVTFSTVVAYLSTGSILGDVNGDGKVNCADVSIVKSGFGTHTGQAGYNIAADLNNDGTVNILDLFIVSRQLAAGAVCQ